MKSKVWFVLCAAALLFSAILPNGVQPVLAQAPEPPHKEVFIPQDCPPEGPCQDENGDWYIPEGARLMEEDPAAPAATGGPDDFGYTWDDTVPFNWVDATNGTDAGFHGDYYQNDLLPVNLPFTFKYYENVYTQVYLSPAGYLTFTDIGYVRGQSEIPYPEEPNNVIAPLWSPFQYANSGTTARAFYKTGGTAPNRYFVAEWYRVTQYGEGLYTFEVQLFENGDILFQYKDITGWDGGYYCTSSGIEDSEGLDGLAYRQFCNNAGNIPANTAVRFTRPGAIARVRVSPLYHGGFTHSGETDTFNFKVTNTGELGNDTYDLTTASLWPVTFYGPDGSTPLTDTDGDTYVDTGSVPQGQARQVYARVAAPAGLALGDENTAFITVSSSLNPYKAKQVQVESTVPAPFTQVYVDQNDNGTMRLDQNWPGAQFTRPASEAYESGNEPAVVETPNQTFVYAWYKYVNTPTGYGYTLSYALLDRFGQVLRPAASLTQPDPSARYSYDGSPVLAAAPDGRVGMAWYRYAEKYENNQWLENYNIWFAVLNPDGSVAYGPANLTNNTAWLPYGNDLIQVSRPAIAASADNRFMLAWYQYYRPGGLSLYEVYTTIRTSSGAQVAPVTKLADGVPGSRRYYYPSVTALSGSRFLLAYTFYDNSVSPRVYYQIRYRAYDSAGGLLKPETASGLQGFEKDGVQLSGGNVLLAGTGYNYGVSYTLLNGLTLNPLSSFNPLDHPSAINGPNNVSVTRDAADHGILTWQDGRNQYIYYALVHANGQILSGPVISRAAKTSSNAPYLETSYVGASTTTNAWAPQAGVDTLLNMSTLFGAAPGGTTAVGIPYANNGLTTAANPQITLTLPAGLTYLGASPNICTLGSSLVCDLPDLAFGDSGSLTVYLGLPDDAPIGSTWALQAVISSAGPEGYPADNSADATVFAGLQVFLPALMK